MCMASDSDPLARCLELKDGGNAALKVGDTAEAIRMYEEAASLAEAHPDKSVLAAVCSNLSAALLRAERAEEALVAAGRSVGARVDWSKAHFRRGEAAFALRQYKEARESYRHAAELDAKEIKEAHGASAVPQRADKSLSAAVAVCDEAMPGGIVAPEAASLMSFRARALGDEGRAVVPAAASGQRRGARAGGRQPAAEEPLPRGGEHEELCLPGR